MWFAGCSTPKQGNLFDPPPQKPEWEELPPDVQMEAIQLLIELLTSPAAKRLLTQGGGANE
jgi:hypothetical protein